MQKELHRKLHERLIVEVNKRSMTTIIKIALLGTKTQICNDALLEIITIRSISDIRGLRLKDMERLLFALNFFNFKSTSGIEIKLFVKALNELLFKRHVEISEHPQFLAKCLHHLAYNGIHIFNLGSKMLKMSNSEADSGKMNETAHEILLLDSLAELNSNQFNGPQLTQKQCIQLMHNYCIPAMAADNNNLNSGMDAVLLDIWDSLMIIFGERCVWVYMSFMHRPGM